MAYSFTVTRDVEARNDKHELVRIALATVTHENGHQETVAVREELIQFAGEGIIEEEVRRKMER